MCLLVIIYYILNVFVCSELNIDFIFERTESESEGVQPSTI